MKQIFIACVLMASLACAPHREAFAQSKLTDTQVDSLVALAHLYGVVRYFHPSQASVVEPWDRFLVDSVGTALEVKSPAQIGPMLNHVFSPFPLSVDIGRAPIPKAETVANDESLVVGSRHLGLGIGQTLQGSPYRSWRTSIDQIPSGVPEEFTRVDAQGLKRKWNSFPLAAGWHAKVRADLSIQEAQLLRILPRKEGQGTPPLSSADSATVTRQQAIAVGIAAWSVALHFYPYWEDINVNWEVAFREWIRIQPVTQSRQEFQNELRRLVALMGDGHAGVTDTRRSVSSSFLPIAIRPMDDGYVVTATETPLVAVGDQIAAVNGVPIAEYTRLINARTSASPHAKPWRARVDLLWGPTNQVAKLDILKSSGKVGVELQYSRSSELKEIRPQNIAELKQGIFYVDISRLERSSFEKALPSLSSAKAIIFDLRGYPSPGSIFLPRYWLANKESAKWMHVPFIMYPFEKPTKSLDIGWNLEPLTGIANVKKILLTDPRAQSFSESLVGYFVAHGNGVIVGEPTSGANGSMSQIGLPLGYVMRFTGMVVTSHDGKRIHGRGFQPNVEIKPTTNDIKSGRDVVLEKALEIAAGEQ